MSTSRTTSQSTPVPHPALSAALTVAPTAAPVPAVTTAPLVVPTIAPSDTSSSMDNDSNHSHSNSSTGGIDSGFFIYAVLLIGLMTAVVYFGRVCLAKRRLRLRARKDPDFEAGPPMYLQHLDDLQVIHAQPRDTSSPTPQNLYGTNRYSNPALNSPATALIRGENYYIVTPRTHSRNGSAAAGWPLTNIPLATPSPATPSPATPLHSSTTQAASSTLTNGSEELPPPSYEDLSPREVSPPRRDALSLFEPTPGDANAATHDVSTRP
ncbi:hypothetical protein BGZ99_005720 [Dissophora globulifera]|uniref:Uncharacterized protein n=1 Tax=Dissophora globulifera TaxID=979702 RepID=A0A9P6RGB4_9FUNG|nr:hypothetical protein BGZ99_005720 [Dissophora globulifera]